MREIKAGRERNGRQPEACRKGGVVESRREETWSQTLSRNEGKAEAKAEWKVPEEQAVPRVEEKQEPKEELKQSKVEGKKPENKAEVKTSKEKAKVEIYGNLKYQMFYIWYGLVEWPIWITNPGNDMSSVMGTICGREVPQSLR